MSVYTVSTDPDRSFATNAPERGRVGTSWELAVPTEPIREARRSNLPTVLSTYSRHRLGNLEPTFKFGPFTKL